VQEAQHEERSQALEKVVTLHFYIQNF
jgi:hypothetical protein